MNELIEQLIQAMVESPWCAGSIAKAFGAKVLGQGVERIAVLIEGEVYKVSLDGDSQTRNERKNYGRMRKRPTNEWRIPPMRFMDIDDIMVNISKYVPGRMYSEVYGYDGKYPTNPWNADDAHYDNIIVGDDGRFYLIDLGYAHGFTDCFWKRGHTVNHLGECVVAGCDELGGIL